MLVGDKEMHYKSVKEFRQHHRDLSESIYEDVQKRYDALQTIKKNFEGQNYLLAARLMCAALESLSKLNVI